MNREWTRLRRAFGAAGPSTRLMLAQGRPFTCYLSRSSLSAFVSLCEHSVVPRPSASSRVRGKAALHGHRLLN
jgi:hypothetical protein